MAVGPQLSSYHAARAVPAVVPEATRPLPVRWHPGPLPEARHALHVCGEGMAVLAESSQPEARYPLGEVRPAARQVSATRIQNRPRHLSTGSPIRGVHSTDPADSTALTLRKTNIRNGETPGRLSRHWSNREQGATRRPAVGRDGSRSQGLGESLRIRRREVGCWEGRAARRSAQGMNTDRRPM